MSREFEIMDGAIVISKNRKDAKPITGTKLGGITGDNPYSSEFVVFMDLYRYTAPFEMNLKVFVGMALEDIVLQNVSKVEGMNFGPYEKTSSGFMARYYDWDLEKGPGKRFNGLIDGWDKENKIVAECKISGEKNFLGRDNNEPSKYGARPPEYYFLQMGMYGLLAAAKEVWLTAYRMPESFYEQFMIDGQEPKEFNQELKDAIINSFVFDESRYEVWKYQMSEIDEELKSRLKFCTEWQEKYVYNRNAPKASFTKPCDVELVKFLHDTKQVTLSEALEVLGANITTVTEYIMNHVYSRNDIISELIKESGLLVEEAIWEYLKKISFLTTEAEILSRKLYPLLSNDAVKRYAPIVNDPYLVTRANA